MSNKVFQSVSALRPGMSVFDLSYMKTFTCDMGQLIPIMADEMVPGDVFKIGNQSVIRFQPLVAPILHEINAYVHYFFVPYRLLWSDWEDFISGGPNGSDASVPPVVAVTAKDIGSVDDYLGFPTGVTLTPNTQYSAFPRYAYNLIYNEYYRDETLQPEVALGGSVIKNRNWEKDYFTSSLPFQQRGTAPALPISGTTKAVWGAVQASGTYDVSPAGVFQTTLLPSIGLKMPIPRDFLKLIPLIFHPLRLLMLRIFVSPSRSRNGWNAMQELVFGIQSFFVRISVCLLVMIVFNGRNMLEDQNLPIIVSEVLQTSETGTSPQGNMAGHGISASSTYCGKYRATEYGVMMGIMSIMPRSMYQQGINRQWMRKTKYDYYFPEFANLSEQAVKNYELYVSGDNTADDLIFGYQGRYDEMRTKQNMVCGQMRNTFSYWHLGRIFSSQPALNSSFITCVPRKDIFAAPSEPGLIVQIANLIKAWRPMPIQSNPGLIDHN